MVHLAIACFVTTVLILSLGLIAAMVWQDAARIVDALAGRLGVVEDFAPAPLRTYHVRWSGGSGLAARRYCSVAVSGG